MIIFFLLGSILGAFAVVFDLQNINQVTMTFYHWQLEGSLAVLLALAFLAGAVFALLMVVPEYIKNYFQYRNLKKENVLLREDLRKQKELTIFAKNSPPPTQEELNKIDRGAIAQTGSLS